MSEPMRRHAAFIVRHARAVVVASLLVAAAIGSGISRLHVNLDPEQQLPADHPYIALDRRIRQEFGGKRFVAIAVVPRVAGLFVPLTMVLSCFTALTLLPALVLLTRPRFIFAPARTRTAGWERARPAA